MSEKCCRILPTPFSFANRRNGRNVAKISRIPLPQFRQHIRQLNGRLSVQNDSCGEIQWQKAFFLDFLATFFVESQFINGLHNESNRKRIEGEKIWRKSFNHLRCSPLVLRVITENRKYNMKDLNENKHNGLKTVESNSEPVGQHSPKRCGCPCWGNFAAISDWKGSRQRVNHFLGA